MNNMGPQQMRGMPMMPPQMMQMYSQMPMNQVNTIHENNCLYVGNLNPDLVEMDLFSEFHHFGPLANVKLMKNIFNNENRGYGFVTYENRENAEKAQKAMNNKEVLRREIRVYFKKNIKNISKEANMVIKNLHKDISSQQLTDECSKFGELISCFVKKVEMKSLGYGYVQFVNKDDAENFLTQFSGKILNGLEVKVERFVPYKERKHPEISNLYLKNFPSDLTQEEVEKWVTDEMGSLGEITSKGVFKDNKLGRFYAFVAYKEVSAAKEAIEKFNGNKKEGSDDEPLYVDFAQPKQVRIKLLQDSKLNQNNKTNMYIRSLKPSVTDEEFKRVFSKYGKILSYCLKDWNRNVKTDNQKETSLLKFGFVNYEKPEEATNLLTNYKTDPDIKVLINPENEKSTFIFYAQPKRVRAQYLRMNSKNKLPFNMMMMQNQFMKGGKKGMNKNPQMMAQNFPNTPMVNALQSMQETPMSGQIGNIKKVLETTPPNQAINVIRKRLDEFEGLSEDDQKNILGHIMYHRVKSVNNDEEKIPKITGMLIDREVLQLDEILEIIENDDTLEERINEALDVLANNDQDDEEDEEDN
jgi:RNA recognition motif-containing protein